MRQITFAISGVFVLLAGGASAQQSTEDFSKSTAKSNNLAIHESELAATQGDDATKALAQRFLNDEKANTQQLQYLNGQSNDPQAPAPKLDDKQQSQVDNLKTLNGDAFSKQYVNDLIAQQRAELSTFSNYMQNGGSPQMKGWAAQNVPKLRSRLQQLEAIQQQENQ